MKALGWIWAWLMLLGAVRGHLDGSLSQPLVIGLLMSGIISLPLLWNKTDGFLRAVAPSGIVRAGLAVMILVIAGISDPSSVLAFAAQLS